MRVLPRTVLRPAARAHRKMECVPGLQSALGHGGFSGSPFAPLEAPQTWVRLHEVLDAVAHCGADVTAGCPNGKESCDGCQQQKRRSNDLGGTRHVLKVIAP